MSGPQEEKACSGSGNGGKCTDYDSSTEESALLTCLACNDCHGVFQPVAGGSRIYCSKSDDGTGLQPSWRGTWTGFVAWYKLDGADCTDYCYSEMGDPEIGKRTGYAGGNEPSFCHANSCSGGASGDPHITFAHGGKADFRGSHRDSYVFVSGPGYQFAPFFQEVDFVFTTPIGLRQLVHGTFMTGAAWRVRTTAGRELLIRADAMKRGELRLLVIPDAQSLANGAAPEHTDVTQWRKLAFDDVAIETRMLSASVVTPLWHVNVTARPIYGLVPPLLNETHVHGHWDEEQKRLDIEIQGAFPQPDAHGIVGQSYRPGAVRRDGKLDEYGADAAPKSADSDGRLPVMTTSAQAEGAIEGIHTDYKLLEGQPFSTAFKFSRFSRVASAPIAGKTKMLTSSTSEWDGVAKAVRHKEL